MMKKLLLLSTMLLTLSASVKAQTYTASVNDTLHYYFNKYYFKTGITTYSNYPYYKDPAPKCNNAVITHVGSRFENAVNDMTVTGLEAFVQMPGTTAKTKIPIHLYLCNLDGAGMPVLPGLDSVAVDMDVSYKASPKMIGGNLIHGPQVMSGDFAVLVRNFSDFCGDTVLLLRTAGLTNTNSATSSQHKYADGNYGYVRHRTNAPNAAILYTTKNFSLAPGFGTGTDYEFMVAPRVVYTVQASQQIPQIITDFNDGTSTDTICTRTNFTFTNTSSWEFTNRFYNLNEFYRKWNLYYPFVATPACCGGFSADSAITWNFEYEEQSLPPRDPRKFLPYRNPNTNPTTISSITDMPGCWDNQFRANLRPMSPFGRQPQIQFNIPFKICLKFCNDDGTGVAENAALSKVRMYPNPANNGMTHITGLQGENAITVMNVIGAVVIRKTANTADYNLDLSQLAAGSYFVKIQNADKQTKTIQLVIGQ